MKRNYESYHIWKYNEWIYARVGVLLLFALVFSVTTEAWALCVQVKKANLRQGPGTKHEKLWEVYQYMPFRKLDAKGSWLKGFEDVDGDIYWIYKKLTTEDLSLRSDQDRQSEPAGRSGNKFFPGFVEPQG